MCAQDCTASSVGSELGDFQFKNRLKIETDYVANFNKITFMSDSALSDKLHLYPNQSWLRPVSI